MELPKELVEQQELNDAQVKAVIDHVSNHIADIKKEYDGKANTDAEGILNGAATKVQEVTGVQRNQGEKLADYYSRAWDISSSEKAASLEAAKKEYDDKVSNFKGSDDIIQELDTVKSKYSELQKREADFETLLSSGIKDKYETLSSEYEDMKKSVAFTNVKPVFHADVNQYEAKAKWSEFEKATLDKYSIKIVDGEPIGIDKENEHRQVKLKDLVAEDASLQELTKGRQQQGIGAKQTDLKEVEGVPFKIPATADSQSLTALVREQLSKENISRTDPKYAQLFADYYGKAKNSLQKTA